MKIKLILIGIFILLAFLFPNINAQNRIVENFNFGWKFKLGEVKNGESPQLDDSTWRTIDVPHDFQVEKPWLTPDNWTDADGKTDARLARQIGARGYKSMGGGWYRKTFTPDPAFKGQRIILDFEGIMLVGDVWINGEKVGKTDYGYTGFEIDITDKLKWEEPNVLAVYANTGTNRNSRWYTGGGLFRSVNLLIKNANISFARHAVYITTPQITDKKATVNLQAEIENLTKEKATAKVKVRLFSPDGKELPQEETDLSLARENKSYEYPLTEMSVDNPQLWSCETPNLYKAELTLYNKDNNVVDRITETFGIRSIEYLPSFGFKLNGKKVLLKGIANHHELGALGAATYDRAIEKRFQLLKSFGVNHIRCSHNPYSKEFYALADKYGFLVVDEMFDKWSEQYAGGRTEWWNIWPFVITESVKEHRNHPSIIMWSLGNELQITENWTGYPAANDWGVTAYKIQNALVKRYDDTRPTTVAMYPRRRYGADLPPELSVATEISAFNYTYKDFRRDAKTFPEMIFYQSEASVKEMGPNFYGMALDSVIGLAYWGLIDYLGESQGWPYKGWRQGAFNIDLSPKPQAYMLKSMFSEEPLVHIGVVEEESDMNWNDVMVGVAQISDHWNYPEGKTFKIYTYTNADEVELFINDRSLGRKVNQVNDHTQRNKISWGNVAYKAGNITAVAYKNGREVARHRIETSGKAVKLVIKPDENPWIANGSDLKHIRVYAVDNKGRRVPDANQLLTFEVKGDARIAAVDNGDQTSNEMHTGNQRTLFKGAALVILRSGHTAENIVLKVSGKGYRDATTTILLKN